MFNLFVFFEVMLIASYGLLLHGGGPRRLRAGFQYVAINLLASTLFLFAVGLIYAVLGTLNMADLALKAPLVSPSDAALLRTGVLLLFLVFAIKAALVPLHLVAAGDLCRRVGSGRRAVHDHDESRRLRDAAHLRHGVRGRRRTARRRRRAVDIAGRARDRRHRHDRHPGEPGAARPRRLRDRRVDGHAADRGRRGRRRRGVTTALYYLVHSTLSGAALFLIVDLIAERRGRILDRLVPAPEIRQQNLLGGLFLLGAIAIVGLPPLSGFIGKLMILQASRGAEAMPWIWSVVLGMTLVMVLGFARAGSAVFWNIEPGGASRRTARKLAGQTRRRLPLAVAGLLIAATAALAAFGGPVTLALGKTAEQTLDTRAYVRAVLGPTALPAQARRKRKVIENGAPDPASASVGADRARLGPARERDRRRDRAVRGGARDRGAAGDERLLVAPAAHRCAADRRSVWLDRHLGYYRRQHPGVLSGAVPARRQVCGRVL